jgi:hypothetical protein
VKIGGGASAEDLRRLAKWGDDHSPISCTTRSTPDYSLDVEVVSA